MGNFKCEKGYILSQEEFDKRNKFWSKEQFRTWNKKELEKDSTKMQKLLVALSRFPLSEIREIRKRKSSYGFKNDANRMKIYMACTKDFDYAMSIAPKTFFKTESPNRSEDKEEKTN